MAIIVYMTPEELLSAMKILELSTHDLSDILNIDERAIRRWITGDHRVPGPVSVILETALIMKKKGLDDGGILLNKNRFKSDA